MAGTQRIVDDVKLFSWEAGAGSPLLVIHGADGGDGVLPFHDGLAERFQVTAPSGASESRSPPTRPENKEVASAVR